MQDVLNKINELKTLYPFVVFATQPTELCDAMKLMLVNDVPFMPLLGSYLGEIESSFMIQASQMEVIKDLIVDQESIMLVSAPIQMPDGSIVRNCKLLYMDSSTDPIDFRVKDIPVRDKEKRDKHMQDEAWTYIPSLGLMWVTAEESDG